MSLLIVGGDRDYNLLALVDAARVLQQPCQPFLIPAKSSPEFSWSFEDSRHLPSGLNLSEKPQAAFIRQDVFHYFEDARNEVTNRANAWYVALKGWILSQKDIRTFNRDIHQMASYKPTALFLAQQLGLNIPRTSISNSMNLLQSLDALQHIAKPVNGGGHCISLDQAISEIKLDFLPAPAIIQNKLISPEYRIFIIGDYEFTFLVDSPSLDYRELQDAKLALVNNPHHEVGLLRQLMQQMRMNFGAADFKTDPTTGELVFLELNTSPMFALFDQISQGKLCQAMVQHLLTVSDA